MLLSRNFVVMAQAPLECVNGRGRFGGQTAGGHPKAFPRPTQPLFAVPAWRELESACKWACCETLSQYPQSAFQGFSGVARGSAAVCDPNPPRPFARYREKWPKTAHADDWVYVTAGFLYRAGAETPLNIREIPSFSQNNFEKFLSGGYPNRSCGIHRWGLDLSTGYRNTYFLRLRSFFGKGMRRSSFQWEKGLSVKRGEAFQWMRGLVRISTGKAIQWRGPGDSVNRWTLKTEKLLSSSPSQKSALTWFSGYTQLTLFFFLCRETKSFGYIQNRLQ